MADKTVIYNFGNRRIFTLLYIVAKAGMRGFLQLFYNGAEGRSNGNGQPDTGKG